MANSSAISRKKREEATFYASLCRELKKMFLMCVYLLLCFCGLPGVFGDEVKSVSVYEGDSVTLHTDIKLQRDDLILWKFGLNKTLIARINGVAKDVAIFDDVLDGRFRDRLQVNNQTGDLTITDITTNHSGDYKIIISGKQNTLLYRVNVYGSYTFSRYALILICCAVGCLMILSLVLICCICRKRKNTEQRVQIGKEEINYTDLKVNETQAHETKAPDMDDLVYAGVISQDDD